MDDLRQLLVGGVPLVVGIRHEPTEHGADLFRYLGVEWRIDPDAPPCVLRCGRPECKVSAPPVVGRVATLDPTDERCDSCPWPDVCGQDRTCWRKESKAERDAIALRRRGAEEAVDEDEDEDEDDEEIEDELAEVAAAVDEDVVADEPFEVTAATDDFRSPDADGKYGCKMPGCGGRSSRKRGVLAFLCDDVHAPARSEQHAQAIAQGRRSTPKPEKPDRSWLHVPGTGLKYRTPEAALEAADEIEADGRRVAAEAVAEGNTARAEQALEAALPLAEKVRAAAQATLGTSEEPVPPELDRISPALEHAALAARLDLSPTIRAALVTLLEAIVDELRAA